MQCPLQIPCKTETALVVQVYKEEKLKAEIAAPYKNNVIGLMVIIVGVLAVLFNYFPGLFEAQEPEFPAIL